MFKTSPSQNSPSLSDFDLVGAYNFVLSNPPQGLLNHQFFHKVLAHNAMILGFPRRNQDTLSSDLNQGRMVQPTAPPYLNQQVFFYRQEAQVKIIDEKLENGESPDSGLVPRKDKGEKSTEGCSSNGTSNRIIKVYFDADASEAQKEDKPESPKQKQAESKDMIKNMAKAIFGFIRKQPEFRKKVLDELGIDEQNFMKSFAELKGKIQNISELRSLWVDSNPFGRAFRMLSFEYLRKYSLRKTFNSRVKNYSTHLKYRQRLLEALRSPENFRTINLD